MTASGIYDPMSGDAPDRGTAAGIAIAALTFVVLLHMFSRRGGILVNNAFAIAKVMLLVAIIALGIAKGAGAFSGPGKAPLENFTQDVFVTNRKDPPSWSNSLMLCMYSYSGYEQPFYVCSPFDWVFEVADHHFRFLQSRGVHTGTSPGIPFWRWVLQPSCSFLSTSPT